MTKLALEVASFLFLVFVIFAVVVLFLDVLGIG